MTALTKRQAIELFVRGDHLEQQKWRNFIDMIFNPQDAITYAGAITFNSTVAINGTTEFTLGATQSINIDAGTTDHTGSNVVSMNLDINSSSTNGFYVDLDVGTALSAAEEGKAYLATVNGLASDADTSLLFGYAATMTGVASSRADLIGFGATIAGTRNGADTDQGFMATFAGTLNNASATQYGVRVSNLSAAHTHTDGTLYGLFVNNTAVVSSGASYSLGLSQTLYSATTKAILVSTTTAIDTATLLSSANISQTMTGASAVNMAEVSQVVLTSNVQVGNWANAIVGKIDFSTAGYVTGLAGVICAELDLPTTNPAGGSGTYTCFEAEINCPTGFTSTVPVSAMNINVWGAAATTFDANGFIFDITGLTSGATNCFYDNDGTAGGDTVNAWLKVRVNGATCWMGLYDTTH